jgi:RNA polymerase sigma-70 factor (ECF subfamily)
LAMTEDAFRAFYDRTARSVWGYLARLTGDPAMADDLLQDTYYRFLRAGTSHENEAHRRNSLFTIATNLARDAARRRRVMPFFVADGAVQVASRDDVAGRVQQSTDVGRALGAMKPRERAMLWLAYAEGSSHKEIAGVLGVKPASVKLLLFRARRRLAGLLGHPPVKGDA